MYLLLNREENLNTVSTVTKIMLAHVDSLFLDDLLAAGIGTVRSEAGIITATSVSALLVERLTIARRSILLFDNVIGWTVEVWIAIRVDLLLHLHTFLIRLKKLIGVLTDVVNQLSPAVFFLSPSGHVVIRFLFLKSLEDDLVFPCDLHKFTLARFTVQTFLAVSSHALALKTLHLVVLLNGGQVSVSVRDALGVLEDVRHLLKKDAVLPFNFSVSL